MIKLVTSNEQKLREFQRYLPSLTVDKGLDLPEVDGTKEEVAIYKALHAGTDHMVEDTILIVDGQEIVDIRFKMDELSSSQHAVWVTTLALNHDGKIKLFTGSVNGRIEMLRFDDNAPGFDSVFIPNGSDLSLYELGDTRDTFSARKKAVEAYLNEQPSKVIPIRDCASWSGHWQ